MVTNHVQHPHRRQARPEQVRSLRHHGSHEQPAVAPALNRQTRPGRVAGLDQPLGGRDEVVEHVLLVLFAPGQVPRLAVLAPAAQVRDRQHTAHLHPHHPGRAVYRRERHVEPAVPIQHRRVRSVQLDAFLVRDEHRDPRPVLALVEHLRRLELFEVDVHSRGTKQRALSRLDVVAVARSRRREAGERVEGLGVVSPAAEPARRADPGQFHLAHERAVGLEHLDHRAGVLEVLGDDPAADEAGAPQRFFSLGHNLPPMVLARIGHVDRDHPRVGCVQRRLEVEHTARVPEEAKQRLPLVDDRLDARCPVLKIDVEDLVLPVAGRDRDDEISAVLGDACVGVGIKLPVLRRALERVDLQVIILRRSERVEVDGYLLRIVTAPAVVALWIPAVVHARAVRHP